MSEDKTWAYNVNKKIAQLTKVVFRLYTENTDRRNLVAAVKQRYETEIQTIRERAERAIAERERDLSQREADYQATLASEYNAKFTAECDRLKSERDKFTAKVGDYESEIESLRSESLKLQDRVAALVRAFEAGTEELQKVHERTVMELKEKYQSEADSLVKVTREKCEKLNERNRELARQIEEMGKGAGDEAEGLRATVKSLTEKGNALEKQNAALKKKVEVLEKAKAKEGQIRELTKANQELKEKMKQIVSARDELQNQLGVKEQRIKELEKERLKHGECPGDDKMRDLEKENNGLKEQLKAALSWNEKMQKQVDAKDQYISDLERGKRDLSLKLDNVSCEVECLRKQTQKHVELAMSISAFERFDGRDMLKNRTRELELKILEKETQLKDAKQRIMSLSNDIEAVKQQIFESNEQLKAAELSHKAEMEAKDSEIKRLTDMLRESDEKVKSLVESHEAQMRQLQNHFDLEMQRMAKQGSMEVQELQARIEELEQTIELNKKRHNDALRSQAEEMQGVHLTELEKSRLTYEHELIERDAIIEKLKEEIKSSEETDDKKRIKDLERQVTERTQALAKVYAELKQYRAELVNRETSYNKMFSTEPDVAVLNVIERRVKRDSLRGMFWNLPPLEKEESKAVRCPTARRKKKMRVVCDQQ